ncbi:uncharacterized protein LOC129251386 [Anastrepha obliqua]|uniref:uncharacterized protein LOC129251386 n=1 Tax=Anastrepha obliqua TaxID=95512 RepID=UPI00240972EF|nr:uncharacterized protein LOC129251386 [Anastrepha obliqua]
MTPYRLRENETDVGKCIFNDIHSKARSIVERSIGVYKGRWRILSDDRKPRYNPTLVAKIANVCAALHNVCIDRNIPYQFSNENLTQRQEGLLECTPLDINNRLSERIRSRIRDHLSQSAM